MKYYEIEMTISPCSQDAQDLLSALSAEAGFETFEETATGLKGYVQQTMFEEETLKAVISTFPIEDTLITYKVQEAEDKDWNEQWEQEGFEPIVVGNRLVIHDGRHLPQKNYPTSIEIDAHLAFGTGTHETTRMICATLMELDLVGKSILDCGCGTGILGICALKMGADRCVGYDIDEWSADNTRHNAVINGVDDRLKSLCGDAALLDSIPHKFDIVVANINRNILLQDMERFVSVMAPSSTLIISGFYRDDCPLLETKAHELGLSTAGVKSDDDWTCLTFKK